MSGHGLPNYSTSKFVADAASVRQQIPVTLYADAGSVRQQILVMVYADTASVRQQILVMVYADAGSVGHVGANLELLNYRLRGGTMSDTRCQEPFLRRQLAITPREYLPIDERGHCVLADAVSLDRRCKHNLRCRNLGLTLRGYRL